MFWCWDSVCGSWSFHWNFMIVCSNKPWLLLSQTLHLIPIVQPTRYTCYLKLFILVKCTTCLGRSFWPSSGAQNCIYSNGIMSNGCCYLLLLGMRWSSCETLCVFRTVFPSIIRDSKLHIQQRYYVKQLLLHASIGDEMEFLWNALRVSDGLSIHHQGLKTACTATAYLKQLLFRIYCCCIHSFELLMIDGKTVRNM